MVRQIEGKDALDAWQQGAGLLVREREIFNLVTTVLDSTRLEDGWFRDFDPSAHINKRVPNLSDVANTIFPRKYLAQPCAKEQVYRRYLKAHERRSRQAHAQRSWGTYFQRMVSFGCHGINQLDMVIEKMNAWRGNHKAAFVMHLSSADTDRLRIMGGPCLQYIEFLCPNACTVDLLSVYRNHDFFAKAFGNFIGLGQLLKFVCKETQREPGILVCHSAHAYYSGTKGRFKHYARV